MYKQLLGTYEKCLACGGPRETKGFCKKCYSHIYRTGVVMGKTSEEWISDYVISRGYNIKGELRLVGTKDYDCIEGEKPSRFKDKYRNLRDDVFDGDISNEAKYFVGLLITDGCVHKDGHIDLSLTDGEIVYRFAEFLGFSLSEVKIKSRMKDSCKDVYRLRFKSEKIKTSLAEYGIVPNKSTITRVPENLLYSPDFIRGVIDGDGTVSFNRNQPVVSIASGSLEFIEGCSKFMDYYEFKYRVFELKYKNTSKSVWNLVVQGGQTQIARFLSLVYNGGVAIHRKNLVAQEIISRIGRNSHV